MKNFINLKDYVIETMGFEKNSTNEDLRKITIEMSLIYEENIKTGYEEYEGTNFDKMHLLLCFMDWDEGEILYNTEDENFYMLSKDTNSTPYLLDENYFKEMINLILEE